MASSAAPLTPEEGLDNRLTISLSRLMIASGTFLVIPLFVAYAMLSTLNNNGMWLPHGVTHPSTFLGLSSVILLVASGLAYLWGYFGLKAGAGGQMSLGASLALLLALVAAICYAFTLNHMGFSFQSGGYASVFFGLTLFYEMCLVALCIFLFGIANRARKGLYSATRRAAVAAFAEFWWWFIVVGVLAYLLLYIVPFLNIESPT